MDRSEDAGKTRKKTTDTRERMVSFADFKDDSHASVDGRDRETASAAPRHLQLPIPVMQPPQTPPSATEAVTHGPEYHTTEETAAAASGESTTANCGSDALRSGRPSMDVRRTQSSLRFHDRPGSSRGQLARKQHATCTHVEGLVGLHHDRMLTFGANAGVAAEHATRSGRNLRVADGFEMPQHSAPPFGLAWINRYRNSVQQQRLRRASRLSISGMEKGPEILGQLRGEQIKAAAASREEELASTADVAVRENGGEGAPTVGESPVLTLVSVTTPPPPLIFVRLSMFIAFNVIIQLILEILLEILIKSNVAGFPMIPLRLDFLGLVAIDALLGFHTAVAVYRNEVEVQHDNVQVAFLVECALVAADVYFVIHHTDFLFWRLPFMIASLTNALILLYIMVSLGLLYV
eukprot:ANDGO_03192.mRNA.1 hypothetical protein